MYDSHNEKNICAYYFKEQNNYDLKFESSFFIPYLIMIT